MSSIRPCVGSCTTVDAPHSGQVVCWFAFWAVVGASTLVHPTGALDCALRGVLLIGRRRVHGASETRAVAQQDGVLMDDSISLQFYLVDVNRC